LVKVAQLGIALGTLGLMLALVGLFPGVIAIPPTPGFGVAQILLLILGVTMLVLGALVYVKFTFYAYKEHTLIQSIGIRLSLTGITFAALAALADVLGFGSNLRPQNEEILLGPIQLAGILINLGIAALGVIIFAVAGDPEIIRE
jgi:hypothetical protein